MGVEFNEQQFHTTRPTQAPSGLVGLVMKMGLAKSRKQANIVLIAILVVCIIAIVVLNT